MRATTPSPRSSPRAALDAAFDRHEVLELVLSAVRARLPHATLLHVTPDGLRASGSGGDGSGGDELVIPRGVAPLEAALATGAPAVARVVTGEAFVDGLVERIAGAGFALVLPITARRHPIAIVVAHGDTPVTRAEVAELFPLTAQADAALTRVLATRARTAAERAPTSVDYEVEVEYALTPAVRRELVAEQRRDGDWAGFAETVRELLRDGVDTGDPGEDEQLELLLELGRVEAEQLGRPEAAIEAWRGALAIDGGEPRVLDALEAQFARLGRWQDCVELLEKRAALAETDGARVAALLNLASIAREHTGDPARAIEAYERVIELSPLHSVAGPALEELYRARKEWGPLAAQLLDRGALVDAADMYEHRVGDLRAAALVWIAVLRREPGRADGLARLAELAIAAQAWDELVPEAVVLAEEVPALWPLVGAWRRDRLGDHAGAIAAFERAVATGAGDVSDVHAALGELCEADPARALAHYERAGDAPAVLAARHRLYVATERWAELAKLLPPMIDDLAASATVDVLANLHVELAAVYSDRLARPDDAVAAYQDALALDPKHALALRGIAAVYEETGQAEALLDVTEAEVDASPAAERAKRYADLAAAWHEHHRFDRAAAAWHKLLALDPKSAVAQQGLARTLREDRRWLELVSALRAQIVLAGYDRLVLLELAEVLAGPLEDLSGATTALEDILAREPDDAAALDASARVHDRAGRLRPALASLERLLALTTDPRGRGDLFERIAQVHLAARDAPAARIALVQAIALDRDNPRAREAMSRVHLQQGELVAAGEELLRAVKLSGDRAETLRRLADAAWLYRHRLGDMERARACLHRILELEPDHADAKAALAELLHDNEEWEALWPHLLAQVAEPDAPASVLLKAARCALELGDHDTARTLYDRACSVAPGPAAQIERAEALYRTQVLDAAALAFQTIATDAAALDQAQRIGVFRRLAQIHTDLGKPIAAQQWHGKVLDLDPVHEATHEDLAELHLAAGRHDDAIASLRALAQAAPVDKKVGLYERIGDLYAKHNPGRATSTYLDALELDGGNRRVLQRLLDLQTRTGHWTRAVETIGKFLDHETEPAKRAAYHLATAEIRRGELRDPAGARDDYERALDEMWKESPLRAGTRHRALETFHQLDTIVTADRDWKYLEQAYRRMIKRAPSGDPVLVVLWHALGELCRSRLEHAQSAIQAFEVAHALDPDKSPLRARILADLYAASGRPAQVTKAAAKLVAADPDSSGAYRVLASSSLQAGKLDQAWCAARALVVLKRANPDEEALYQKYKPRETAKAKGILDDDAWAFVRHPDEDRAISAAFAMVWEAVAALRAGPAKSFELKPRDLLPVEDDTRVVGKIFRHAVRVLGVALPDVYAQPRRAGALMLASVVENKRLRPAVLVGRDLMTGFRDTELAAAIGAMLAQLRPSYYLRLALTTAEELEATLAAAGKLVGKTLGRPELAPLVDVFAPAIEPHLTRATGEALRAVLERVPERPDLSRWRAAVDATAQRAGLLVAGELAAAARMTGLGGSKKRVADLIAYSVSPEYLAVRQHLGVSIAP